MGFPLAVMGIAGPKITVIAAHNDFAVGFFLGNLAVIQKAIRRCLAQPQIPVHHVPGKAASLPHIYIGGCTALLPSGSSSRFQSDLVIAPGSLQSCIRTVFVFQIGTEAFLRSGTIIRPLICAGTQVHPFVALTAADLQTKHPVIIVLLLHVGDQLP